MTKEDIAGLKGERLRMAATQAGIKNVSRKKADDLRVELTSIVSTKKPKKFGGNSHDRRKQRRAW